MNAKKESSRFKVEKDKCDDVIPPPMIHYKGKDKLELYHQVFRILGPNNILNLAPDFVKTLELTGLQEACHNEGLYISRKRLKSILMDTKCPTDTESSDDNDDEFKKRKEHVSLKENLMDTKCPTDTESSDDNDDEFKKRKEHVSLKENLMDTKCPTDTESSDDDVDEFKKRKEHVSLKENLMDTKCPTDTESSDDDVDELKKRKEHVSLKENLMDTKCPTDTESSDDDVDEFKKRKEHVSLKENLMDTKCPTDTESSDDDVDELKKRKEHVSLKENFPDNELAGDKSNEGNGKRDKTNAKNDETKRIDNVSNSEGAAYNRHSKHSKWIMDKKSRNKICNRKRTLSARESQDYSTVKVKIEEKKNTLCTASFSSQRKKETEQAADDHYNKDKENNSMSLQEIIVPQSAVKSAPAMKKERKYRLVLIPIAEETLLINDSLNETTKNCANDNTTVQEKDSKEVVSFTITEAILVEKLYTETTTAKEKITQELLPLSLKANDVSTQNIEISQKDNDNGKIFSNELNSAPFDDDANDDNYDIISLGENVEAELNEILQNGVIE